MSFPQGVRQVPVELVGGPKLQRFWEGSNDHPQECQTDPV